jgi:DNA uptake protein ComE-like DNA-binding protein
VKAFMAGVGIGIGIGILFAPDSGEVSRRKLRGRVSEWSGSLENMIDEKSNRLRTQAGPPRETGSDEEVDRKNDQARAERSGSADSVNTMSREELMNVSGIGPVLADKIISGRPYGSARELLERGILPRSTFNELERDIENRQRRSV